eukprot:1160203-Pelagomonas_calceolata.AAC.9
MQRLSPPVVTILQQYVALVVCCTRQNGSHSKLPPKHWAVILAHHLHSLCHTNTEPASLCDFVVALWKTLSKAYLTTVCDALAMFNIPATEFEVISCPLLHSSYLHLALQAIPLTSTDPRFRRDLALQPLARTLPSRPSP